MATPFGVVVLAWLSAAGTAGVAVAATATPPPGCGTSFPITVQGNVGSEPNVYAPGSVATMRGSVHNGAGDLTDATIRVQLVSPNGHGGPTPSLSWQVDGRGAHAIGLSWVQSGAGDPFWVSDTVAMGSLAAAGHTLTLRVSFRTGDPSGMYGAMAYFGAQSCGDNLGYGLLQAAYEPRASGGGGTVTTAKSGTVTTAKSGGTTKKAAAAATATPHVMTAPGVSPSATVPTPPTSTLMTTAAGSLSDTTVPNPSGSDGAPQLAASRAQSPSPLILSAIALGVLAAGAGALAVVRRRTRLAGTAVGGPAGGTGEPSA